MKELERVATNLLRIAQAMENRALQTALEKRLWPSIAVGIEKAEPEPGVRDGRICKLLWPSISERK
jgi:predicted carbohydrate-binding protein with CBM5 and CBM33 domain